MGENRFVQSDAVTERLQQAVELCDLIVGTEEEIRILGGESDTIAALKAIRARTDALIVCKLGAEGCVPFAAAIPDGLEPVVPGFPVEVFNVLGAGDAFMAGFLSGWLRGKSAEELLPACQRLRSDRRLAPRLRARDADGPRTRIIPCPR